VSNKRILVIDDDPDLLFLVAHGVKSLQPDYQVTTAVDGNAALRQVQKQKFELVITDYMMPEMTGLELIQKIRALAPETHFILMTAHHDSQRIRNSVNKTDLKLSGFVAKPFAMPELLETVRQAIAQIDVAAKVEPAEISKPDATIQKVLHGLRHQVGAHQVLLVNAAGSPVQVAGNLERSKAFRLAAFVSANFLAIIELANFFGDNESVFRSSYYEGSKYNIYAHDINGHHFLAVVFDAGGKPGSVWVYTRQAAKVLAALLPVSVPPVSGDVNATLAEDFNNLLGSE
jgi:CheY-like chemotaxis protein/predicted regulator of Ras-like GTPase activity (Roadblock/LC7/MglB family)